MDVNPIPQTNQHLHRGFPSSEFPRFFLLLEVSGVTLQETNKSSSISLSAPCMEYLPAFTINFQ